MTQRAFSLPVGYNRSVPKPAPHAADVEFEIDDDVLRLTSLLCAAKEDISLSSFDHLVRLTQNVMQCSKAVLLISDPFDPDVGDVVRGPGSGGIDSALVRHALDIDEAVVLSDVAADERFVNDPLVTGTTRVGYFASAPLFNSSGERVGTLCVTDTTPRKWLRSNEIDAMEALAGTIIADMALDESRLEVLLQETELRRLNEVQALKDDFVATVSHELRTPLTSILASLSLLEDGIVGELSDEVRDVVHVATSNSARLVSIVDDLLDLEKMESGTIELVVSSAAIEELMGISLSAVEGNAQKVGIELVREDRFEAGTKFDCDPERIVQVLVNLLGNAIKFASFGTTVTLRAEIANYDHLVFSVVDWGQGIPEESLSKLFDPFWQDDSSAARRVGGSGLGLSISKKIVEQHRGRLEVDSTLGIGSTFRVILPLKAS
jgi:signal transduction histidine kinase